MDPKELITELKKLKGLVRCGNMRQGLVIVDRLLWQLERRDGPDLLPPPPGPESGSRFR